MSKFLGVNRIMFDLDNTLIKHDFDGLNSRISKHFGLEGSEEFKKQFNAMLRNHHVYINGRIVTKEYFLSVIEKLMPILKTIGKTADELLNAIDMYHTGTLMEGADELLSYLNDKGYQIIAFTNWFYNGQMNILKKLGISEYFERIYAWDDYYAKPSHYAIERALAGTDPRKNVMIGDDVRSDIILAKSSGVKAIGFNVKYGKYGNNVNADVNVTSLIDVKKYL